MLKQVLSTLRSVSPFHRRALGDAPSYEEAREALAARNLSARRQLAEDRATPPEMLYYLAADAKSEVRALVAANPATPVHADEILVDDAAHEVRGELARKIARLVPGLSGCEADTLCRRTLSILERLAEDAMPRIRRIVAEELAREAGAPRHVIERLAHDPDLSVAGPILRYSPLLSDRELVELIAAASVEGRIEAIARRDRVSEEVSDAIVASLEIPAVAALLANANAKIRERTMAQIVSQAEQAEALQKPLVLRKDLSVASLRRIADFVSAALLDAFSERGDLDEQTASVVRRRVKERLAKTGGEEGARAAKKEEARARVGRALEEGRLDEAFVLELVGENDAEATILALATMAKVTLLQARKIVDTQTAKPVTALAWKAGLSMRAALRLQADLAHIPPSERLHPLKGGAYPVSPQDMAWHLDYFGIEVGD